MLLIQSKFLLGTLAVSLACSAMGGLKEREEEVKRRSEAKKAADKEQNTPSKNHDGPYSAFGSGTYSSAGSSFGGLTFGVKYYPFEWLGAEFHPAWYRWDEIMIRDYDLSISMGYCYLQFRTGYRWLWDQGVVDVQSGPYAGISLSC